MKPLFAALLLAALAIGCSSPEKKLPLNMAGAYKMLSQAIKSDSIDTVSTSLQQLKIFTAEQVMYANINSPDSISAFGVGYYSISADSVAENIIYSSFDSTADDTARHYTLQIEKTAKGYKQIIPNIGLVTQHIKLTEEYETAGTDAKTPLDGIWKLVSRVEIKGKDTLKLTGIQYKTYYAGQCLWGHTWKDSLNKSHTGIGFGKFEMNGTNKVKESMVASTYADVRGHDFDITIEMNGADGFTQTTDYVGVKGIEVYERLKK